MYPWNYIMSDEVFVKHNNWTRVFPERELMIDKQLVDSMNNISYGAYERDEDICEEEEEW